MMLTPKEKAEKLFNKYFIYLRANLLNDEEAIEDAKVCTLILVNEMLNNFLSNKTTKYGRERYYFWQQVKLEVEKL